MLQGSLWAEQAAGAKPTFKQVQMSPISNETTCPSRQQAISEIFYSKLVILLLCTDF